MTTRSARLALPAVGDVIRYAYLWSHEHEAGREEASKDRPAAVVALVRIADDHHEVAVIPITSSAPDDPREAVEIPPATRARLGLQEEACWVVVSEFNVFAWPGPDLRPVTLGSSSVVYGQLPPKLMARIREAFAAWRKLRPQRTIRRTE